MKITVELQYDEIVAETGEDFFFNFGELWTSEGALSAEGDELFSKILYAACIKKMPALPKPPCVIHSRFFTHSPSYQFRSRTNASWEARLEVFK